MQNVLQTGKRAVSVAVAAATMLFTVGAGLLQPSVAAAASSGDLIKGTSLSTVYYYGYDGMRYTFPNEKTYMTWFADFDSVTTISDSALADLSLAGNVVYRPGSYWIKVQSDDKVYAVSTDGSIHWIESEDVAVDYAGSSWASMVQDVPDVFFTDYSVGSSLMEATAFDGMLYMDGGSYYIAWDGEARMVSSAGRSANGLQASFFLSGDGIDASSLTAGDDITDESLAVMDVAQTESDVAPTSGDVSVSLASSTPASATVPDAASRVEVATFKFTAGDAATVDVLNVSLMGLASTSDIAASGVYLYEGSERLSEGKSFNSSTRQAIFGSLGLDFAAGETRYISVVVDMGNNNSTTTFSVGIDEASDVEASGDVSGSFPIEGNDMSIVNSGVGGVTIIDTGSLSNPVVGENDAVISKFKLTASSTEDVSFESITLEVNDAADHSDFQLWQDGDWLADGEYIGDDLVLFDLGSGAFEIEAGEDFTFDVSADIGGEATNTITTHLENAADLQVVGLDFGFGVAVTDADFDTVGEGSSVTIQGGELSIAFDGPTAADVSNTASNVSFFEGSLTAELAMTITAMPFNLAMVNDDATGLEVDPISDIRIINADTGALLMGPLDLASSAGDSTSETLSFTDDFDMDAGETLNFKVTADMESTAEASDTFAFTLDLTSGLTAEDSSGDAITDIVPGANLSGNAMTVVVSALTVSLASTPSGDRSYVRGTSGAEMAAFNLAAANGGDIELTDLTATVYIDADSASTYTAGTDTAGTDGGSVAATSTISTCSLYDGSTVVSGPESVSSAVTGDILFEDFSYWISAGSTETLTVKCDLANVSAGATADQYAIEIDASGDVTAKDEDGDTATVSGSFGINASETVIISVFNTGALAVTAASDIPTADFILTGSSATTVSKFRFDASREAFVVNRLTVEEAQAAADGASSDAYANNVSLVTISYPDSTGATMTASGALTGGALTFNDLTFYVGKDSNASVSVAVTVPSTDRSGGSATSNERVRMVLDDGTGELRAVGQGSGQTLSDSGVTGVDTAGSTMNKFLVRETKPTVSVSSSSPSGAKVPGDQAVLNFNVAASSGEDVVLKNMVFSFSSSDNATSAWNDCDGDAGAIVAGDFDLYDSADLSTVLDGASDWTLLESNGTVCDGGSSGDDLAFVKLALTTADVIPAGTTVAYSLYFDSTGASSVSDDSIQVGLAGDPITSSYVALGTARTASGAHTAVTTTLTASGALDTTADSAVAVGDVLAIGTERLLVVAYTGGASTATVLRGYLGTTPAALVGGEAITRLPGAMLWQDDGSTGVTSALQEYYGAHLVKTLPSSGNGISF
jgi:hypothetical protein